MDGALVVFKQEITNKWRFSYVTELKQNATHWKRFTYLLGEGERCKTASDRFEKIKEVTKAKNKLPIQVLNDAFSVEKMSKEFFDTYRLHYGKFTAYLTGEDEKGEKVGRAMSGFATFFPNETEVAKKNARDFVKKMMGRIVFLYFLEKKGWLGVPQDKDWGEGDEYFMSNLIKNAKNPEIFYSEVLVPLFFDTLNTPRPDDLFKVKASAFKKGDYHKLKIPYLNGGLFEEEAKVLRGLVLPEKLFHNPKAKSEDEYGLFQFLDQYNFTVDEDSKLNHTVAVDPEMMGHIFENLLEDNKDKGTFYTPKPIVEYMCQESLLEYLCTKLNADDELRKKLDVLIRVEGDGMEPLVQQLPEIVTALKNVKICDPAIGSGAFPMGMLMEIYHIMEKLSTYSVARKAWPITSWDDDSHKIKLDVIQNNIYGVDIEKGAVDIARLRFWLSLIVDLEKPQALPNLDYKIVQGNSLLNELHINSSYKINVDIDWNIDARNIVSSQKKLADAIAADLKKLNDEQKKYFDPKSDKKIISQTIRDLKVEILTNQIELDKYLYNNSAKGLNQADLFGDEDEQENAAKNKKKNKQDEENRILKLETFSEALKHLAYLKKHPTKQLEFFNYELNFADILNKLISTDKGFDIVIGNPPYIQSKFLNAELKQIYSNKYKTAKKQFDIFNFFIERSKSLLKASGICNFIIPDRFIVNPDYLELRSFIFGNYKIKEIITLGDGVFEEVNMPTAILSLFSVNDIDYEFTVKKRLDETGSKVDTAQVKRDSQLKIPAFIDSNSVSIINKVNSKAKKIFNYFDDIRGVEIGKDSELIIDKEQKRSVPFLRGSDISKYYSKSTNYLKLGNTDIQYKDEKWYRGPKLLFRKTGIGINATIDYTDSYVIQVIFVFKLKSEFIETLNYNYVLGIINSKLTEYWYFKVYGQEDRSTFPHLTQGKIKDLPILIVNSEYQDKIGNIVTEILSLKSKDKETSNLEKKIDRLIYKLYELSYNEVKVIEPDFALTQEEYEAIEI